VEERFYLLWPVILVFLLRKIRNNRFGLLVTTSGMIALMILYNQINEFQPFCIAEASLSQPLEAPC